MRWAAATFSSGGTIAGLRAPCAFASASLISAAVALGNSDQRSAIAPVTKGVATLVPPNFRGFPSAPRLVIASPGAPTPRLPIELPRLESLVG